MNPAAAESLRRSAAHMFVDDVVVPLLDDAAAHHLFRVLRIRDGDVVTVTDGAGRWRSCRAVGSLVEPDAEPEFVARREAPVTVAFAIPKQDRPEWIVQKLTEIGVDRIVLLQAERSVVRWTPERAGKHVAKLGRVAIEALQQSRGVWLPVVEGPRSAAEVLPHAVVAEPGGRPLDVGDCTIAIGPEGGWTVAEIESSAGSVALGSTVLRVETAAVVAATLAIAHSV